MPERGAVERNRLRSNWRYLWIPLMLAWATSFGVLLASPAIGSVCIAVGIILAVAYHRYLGVRTLVEGGRVKRIDDRIALLDADSDAEQMSIDTKEIAAGFYNDHDRVVLEMKDRTEYHISCFTRGEADAIMTAAGVTVDRRAMRVPLSSPLGMHGAGPALGCVLLLVLIVATIVMLATANSGAAISVMLSLLVIRLFQRREVVVGMDGLLLQRVISGSVFIPFAEVTQVENYRSYVDLHTRDGKRRRLRVRWTDPFAPEVSRKDEAWGNKALHYRLEQTIARRRLGGAGIRLDQLDRRNRPVDEWRADLMRVAAAAGGYRDPAVLTQSLAIVVSDPNELPERRVGAAIALAETSDEGATRVRQAADACAEPQLSEALRAAAEKRVHEKAIARASEQHAREDPSALRLSSGAEEAPWDAEWRAEEEALAEEEEAEEASARQREAL